MRGAGLAGRLRPGVVTVALATLALVLVAGVGLWFGGVRAAAAEAAGRYTPPSTAVASLPIPVTFYGDSYTFGVGASSTRTTFVALVAADEGWLVDDLAAGGTGYVEHGTPISCGVPRCPDYDQALANETGHPQIVVVTGGRNDAQLPASTTAPAIAKFYGDLRRRYPDATLYAVSPVWDSTAPPASLAVIADAVRTGIEKAGGTYLDIGEPLRGRPALIESDHVHPNDAGHRAIALAIEAALARVRG